MRKWKKYSWESESNTIEKKWGSKVAKVAFIDVGCPAQNWGSLPYKVAKETFIDIVCPALSRLSTDEY